MKKIIQILTILAISIVGINSVKGADSEYGIYCQYGDYFFLYSGANKEVAFYLDQNFNGGEFSDVPSLGVSIEDGRPGLSLFTLREDANGVKYQPEIQWLQNSGLLDENGKFTCPTNPFGTTLGAPSVTECLGGSCSILDIPTSYESYTCNYKSSKENKTLKFDFEYNESGPKWSITYPDGTNKTITGTEINGNFMPGKDCEDIYYVPSKKIIKVALPGNEGVSNNPTLSGLCDSYQISEIEHYCSGNCDFPEMVCSSEDYVTVSCGSSIGIPAALPRFIRNIINIIKIVVPIILVIMGMLDFAKAMTSQDEKNMKDAQNKFVRRLIAGIAILLVVTITQFIFRIINTNDANDMVSCIDCFINYNCSTTVPVEDNPNAYECYQCNSLPKVFKWGIGSGADSSCPSGYHTRPDLTTEGTCHS